MTFPSAFMPYDVALYQGKIYLGGTFSFSGVLQDIMVYDGVSWEPVGGSLQGGINWVSCMEVFQDKLYVGGVFHNADGNAGNAIMTWDGSTWAAVGTGIQDVNGNYHQGLQVYGMKEHDGKLFAGGNHYYAGNIPSAAISTWDGNEWCNVGDGEFNGNNVRWIEFYQDTLWVACGPFIDGDSVNYMAKWVGGAYSDTCSLPLRTEQLQAARDVLTAVPIGDGSWGVLGLFDGGYVLEGFDALGHVFQRRTVSSIAGRSEPIDLRGLNTGAYSLRISGRDSSAVVRVVLFGP